MPDTGYAIDNITSLRQIAEVDRVSDYARLVSSKQAWYIFVDSSSETADGDNIIQPTTGSGRWYKLKSYVVSSDIKDLLETIDDRIYVLFTESGTIGFSYDDNANTFTPLVNNNSINNSHIQSDAAISISKIANLSSELSGKASNSHIHTHSDITGLTEYIQDVLSTTLIQGTNITIDYDDVNNILTIGSTATGGGGGGGALDWDAAYDAIGDEWDDSY